MVLLIHLNFLDYFQIIEHLKNEGNMKNINLFLTNKPSKKPKGFEVISENISIVLLQ